MGATLADGGVNPLTRERVVEASLCHYVLAVMTTARSLGMDLFISNPEAAK